MRKLFKRLGRWFNYRTKRANVRVRQKRRALDERSAREIMNLEQRDVFDLVENLVRTHPETIRYDKKDHETLIIYNDVIITVKKEREGMVYVDNHKGFQPQWFHDTTFAFLNDIIDREAHRFRRKLKHEVRSNRRNFIRDVKEQAKLDSGR